MITRLPSLIIAALLFASLGCIEDEPAVGTDTQYGYGWNGYGWNGYGWNGYGWNGYGWNGYGWNGVNWNALIHHPTTLDYLKRNPLDSKTYAQREDYQARHLRVQLTDELTQQFMHYMVGCALGPDDPPVKWQHPAKPGEIITFYGALGVCPEWAYKSIEGNEACQEKLSGCMLARNNPYERKVAISMRGPGGDGPIPLADVVPALAPVESLVPCDSIGPVNCGWQAEFVGTCAPDSTVDIKLANKCSGYQYLRACEGVGACDSGDDRYLKQEYNVCKNTSMRITCPEGGVYSLMKRHLDGDQPSTAMLAPTSGSYPASEQQIFKFPEGSFFGTVFDASGLGLNVWIQLDSNGDPVRWYRVGNGPWQQLPEPPRGQITAHTKMFACNSPEWDTETALKRFRVCAGPKGEEQCAAQWVGNCLGTDDFPGQKLPSAKPIGACELPDSLEHLGDGDYDNCSDRQPHSDRLWKYPMTVYLADKCALADPERACASNKPPGIPPIPVIPLPPLPVFGR